MNKIKKFIKNITIPQGIIISIFLGLAIFIFTFDNDEFLLNKIKSKDKLPNFIVIVKNIEKYKKDFNIKDEQCKNDFSFNQKQITYTAREKVIVYNKLKTQEQADKWIKEYPKTYAYLENVDSMNKKIDESMNLCITKNGKETRTIKVIEDKLNKNYESNLIYWNDNKTLSCENYYKTINVNNKSEYQLDETKKFIYKSNSDWYDLKFCSFKGLSLGRN